MKDPQQGVCNIPLGGAAKFPQGMELQGLAALHATGVRGVLGQTILLGQQTALALANCCRALAREE